MRKNLNTQRNLWRDLLKSFGKAMPTVQSFEDLSNLVLSILVPSSSCSATRRSGNEAGMIRRGDVPGTQEYCPKSVIFSWSRKKSSSRKHCPVTPSGGELRIAMIASEKIVGFRRSLLSALCDSVAADSIACTKHQ
jgi:hypothetical protein